MSLEWIPWHGGDLVAASHRFGCGVEDWLDLSTGINPQAYPVSTLPPSAFTDLPYPSAELLRAAVDYYHHPEPLAVAGSQAVIQLLPTCLPDRSLLVPTVGYQEYRHQWALNGRAILEYPSLDYDQAQAAIDQQLSTDPNFHLLLINPNNPTGLQFQADQILSWSQRLAAGCYLIVDEAFMDLSPKQSLLQTQLPDNVIVLRSVGKFFGLAGIRLGFVFCARLLREALQKQVGLWSVSGPASVLGIDALSDQAWHQQARLDINRNSKATEAIWRPLMEKMGGKAVSEQGLFLSYLLAEDYARWIFDYCATRGILLRPVAVANGGVILRSGIVDVSQTAQLAHLRSVVNSACTDYALAETDLREVAGLNE